jgi:Histidine kinase-, DNA gyrase B-, and HSP90-like ATPase
MTVKGGRVEAAPAAAGREDERWTPLHYTARAGLLSELGRQTYDTLYKSLREAMLNGIDAGAGRLSLDFGSRQPDTLVVQDDGEGMTLEGIQQSFMSLGGSAKYNDASKFGRIGIGSLALLTYAREAVLESKCAGSRDYVEAQLFHPGTLDREERRQPLSEFSAGIVTEHDYEGDASDHFTRITLRGLAPELRLVCEDPSAYFELIDQLRRVLPLPLGESRLLGELRERHPELVRQLLAHCESWSTPVHVNSPFQADAELTRRTYGDEPGEQWSGPVQPILKTLRAVKSGERREIVVAGFMLNQRKASPEWSGLTARVQNVAVEEQTFFGVEADPGFRKYIAGEIFLMGEIDTDRLININRTSFNREARDYEIVQRFLAAELESFKKQRISQPQRSKVNLRRVLEAYRSALHGIGRVAGYAEGVMKESGLRALPSSKNGSLSYAEEVKLPDLLPDEVVELRVGEEGLRGDYEIVQPEGSESFAVTVSPGLASPTVKILDNEYGLAFRRGRASGPPVIVKNRPREIVFNLGHPAVGEFHDGKAALALASELAFVLPREEDASSFQNRLFEFLAAI